MSSYVNFYVWIETKILPYLLVAVCIVSTTISLVLNTALIMTLKKRNILCTPYGHLFLQFTIVDLIACLTILIPTCVVAIMMSWELTAYSCYAQGVLTNLLYLNNFTILSFLVIERSVKVKNMELYRILFGPKRNIILPSVCIWIINIGISLIPLSDWVEISYHTYHAACVVRLSKSMYYLVAVFSIGIGISFCVGICTCPCILYKRAKEIRRSVNDSGIKEDYMSNENTTNNKDYHRSHTSNVLGSESDNIKQDNRNEKREYQSHLRLPTRLQTAKHKFKAAADISKSLFVSDYTEDFRFASTVFIIWVVMIVCWLPYFIVVFYDSLHSGLWSGFYTVTLVVALPSYCIKPLIFLTYNRNVSSNRKQTQQSNQQSAKAKSFRKVVDKLDRLLVMSVKRKRTVDTSAHVQIEMTTKNQNYAVMKDSTSGKLTSVSAISNKSNSDRNISYRHESRKNTINNRRDSNDSQNPKKKENSLSKTVANGILSNNIKSEIKVSTDGDKSNSFYDSQNDGHRLMPSNKRTDVNVNVRKIQVKPENTEKGRTENGIEELDSGTSGIGGYSVGLGNDQQNETRIEVTRRENPTSDQSFENHAAYRPYENMQRTVIVNKHRSDNAARTTIPMDPEKNNIYSENFQSITTTTDTTTSSSHQQSTNFVMETKVRQSSGNFSENTNSHKQHSSHEASNTKRIVAVKAYNEMLNSVASQSQSKSKSDKEQFYNENDTTDGSTLKGKLNKHETDLSHRTDENRYETLSHLTHRNVQFSKNNAHETNNIRKHEKYHNGIRNSSSSIFVSGAFTENQTNNKNASIIQRDKSNIQKTKDLNNINTTVFEADQYKDKNSNSELKGNKRESNKRRSVPLSNKRIDETFQTQTVPISNKLTERSNYYTTTLTTNTSVKEHKYHNTLTTNKGIEEAKYHIASTANKSVEETKYQTASTTNKSLEAKYHIASTANKGVEEVKYHTASATNKSVEVPKNHTAPTTNKGVEETKFHTASTTNKGVEEAKYHIASTANKGVEEAKYHIASTANKGVEETKYHTSSTRNKSLETKFHTASTANKGVEETKYHTASTPNKGVEKAKYHITSTANKGVEEARYHIASTANKGVEEAKYHTASTTNKSVEVPKNHVAPKTNKGVEETKYHTASTKNKSLKTKFHTASTANKGFKETEFHTASTTNQGVEEDKYRVASTANKSVDETKYHTASTTTKGAEEANNSTAPTKNTGVEEVKYRTAPTTNTSVDDTKCNAPSIANKGVENKYHTASKANKNIETKYHTSPTTNESAEETEYHTAPKTNTSVEEAKYHNTSTTNKIVRETKYRTVATSNKNADQTKNIAVPPSNQHAEETKYQNVRNFHQIKQNAELGSDAYCAHFEDQYVLDAPRQTFSKTKRYSSNRNASTTISRAKNPEQSTENYIVTAETNVEQYIIHNKMALGSSGNDGYPSLVDKPVNIVGGKSVEYSDRKINFYAPTVEDTNLSNKGTLHYKNEVSQSEAEKIFSKYGNQNLHHGNTTFQNQIYDTRMKTRNNSEKDLLSSEYSFKPESSATGGTLLGPFPVTSYQKQNYDTRVKTFLKNNNSEKVLPLFDYSSNPESSATGGNLSGRFPYDIPVYKAPLRNTVTSHIDNGSMDKALLRDIAKDKSKICNKHPYGIYNSIHGDNNHFC